MRLALAALGVAGAAGDFLYPDFNQTQGLIFNADAATSSCLDEEFEPNHYGDVQSGTIRPTPREWLARGGLAGWAGWLATLSIIAHHSTREPHTAATYQSRPTHQTTASPRLTSHLSPS